MIANQEFWEDDLEVPATELLLSFQNPDLCKSWINSLNNKQLNVILKQHFNYQQHLFDNSPYYDYRSVQQKRKFLIDSNLDYLPNYYLISYFSRLKSDSAIIEIAKPILSGDVKYDKKSILFTLFLIDHNLLKHVFLFNKVQKRSFSSFILNNPPRQRQSSFKDFLSKEVLREILTQHDSLANDNFESKFKGFFYYQDRIYLFIRRASDSDLVLSSNQVIHGYKPDWIILDFSLNSNQVNLCTKNLKRGLEIANSIASRYFQRECSFINLRNQNKVAQVRTFLTDCVHELIKDIKLIELKFTSPEPSTYFTLNTNSIEKWLKVLEPSIGSIIYNISLVQHTKVIFRNKKVTLSFHANTDYIAINYSEHVLDKKEREDFKLMFSNTYGLTILSKAKSNFLQANSY